MSTILPRACVDWTPCSMRVGTPVVSITIETPLESIALTDSSSEV